VRRVALGIAVLTGSLVACGTLVGAGDEPGGTSPDASDDVATEGEGSTPQPPPPPPPSCDATFCADFESTNPNDGFTFVRLRPIAPNQPLLAIDDRAFSGAHALHTKVTVAQASGEVGQAFVGQKVPEAATPTGEITCTVRINVLTAPTDKLVEVLAFQFVDDRITAGIYLQFGMFTLRRGDSFVPITQQTSGWHLLELTLDRASGLLVGSVDSAPTQQGSALNPDGGFAPAILDDLRVGLVAVAQNVNADSDILVDELRCNY
jgi:hypothetical protein